jgi:hypothetical protein
MIFGQLNGIHYCMANTPQANMNLQIRDDLHLGTDTRSTTRINIHFGPRIQVFCWTTEEKFLFAPWCRNTTRKLRCDDEIMNLETNEKIN